MRKKWYVFTGLTKIFHLLGTDLTPSTQTLKAFESFSRHGTVWKVAQELNLTRSAVSHRLRQLERETGLVLFQRSGRGVTLTNRGRTYAKDIRGALALIDEAATTKNGRGTTGALTISCIPGFASLWLCPRIGEFQALYPEIALSIQTPRQLDEADNPNVDLFIAFGDGGWPGYNVELLSEVDYTPMCSPAMLNRLGGFAGPADLRRANLLHLGDLESWTLWFNLAGLELDDTVPGILISDKNLVLSAAMAGQGVALGDELTCSRDLAAGRLVRPFDLSLRTLGAYYFVTKSQKAHRPAVAAFRSWLFESLASRL